MADTSQDSSTTPAMQPATGSQRYLDAKTIDRNKRLDIRARAIVEGFLTGKHQSPYSGLAVEFATHREYAPGDEIKHIDWKVWSKTDRLYIKEYEEETNLRCTLVLDGSRSMRYGEATSGGFSKFDYAATAAGSLGYLLQRQQDSVGLVLFDTEVRLNLPPASSATHLKRILHELDTTEPDRATDAHSVFTQLAPQIRQRGLVVLLSDFLVPLETLSTALQQFRLRRHDVIVMHVLHEDELSFPFDTQTMFRGLESDTELHTDPRALRRSYLEVFERYLVKLRGICARAGADHLLLSTADPLDAALAGYLTLRQRRRRDRR